MTNFFRRFKERPLLFMFALMAFVIVLSVVMPILGGSPELLAWLGIILTGASLYLVWRAYQLVRITRQQTEHLIIQLQDIQDDVRTLRSLLDVPNSRRIN